MTEALRDAFRAASGLADAAQDELAVAILMEVAAVQRSGSVPGPTNDVLARMADEALDDEAAGRTEVLDPGEL